MMLYCTDSVCSVKVNLQKNYLPDKDESLNIYDRSRKLLLQDPVSVMSLLVWVECDMYNRVMHKQVA